MGDVQSRSDIVGAIPTWIIGVGGATWLMEFFPSMETQRDLFDEFGEPKQLSAVVAEIRRLTRQAQLVLARLLLGPATNMELILISTRFSARIFELRKKGYFIETEYIDRAKGLTLYTLRKEHGEDAGVTGADASNVG